MIKDGRMEENSKFAGSFDVPIIIKFALSLSPLFVFQS